VDVIEVLIIGHFWFKVPVRGDLGLILLLSGLFAFSGLGIGLLASTIANTQQEALLLVMMVLLPSIFLSGFFFPLDAMPVSCVWSLRNSCATTRDHPLSSRRGAAFPPGDHRLSLFAILIMELPCAPASASTS
jgi:ABC-2 type transport system permease protein